MASLKNIASIQIDRNPVTATTINEYARTFYPGEWKPNSYEQEIRRIGGFWTASFDLVGPIAELERFLRRGLMRRVRSYLPDGRMAWEGYINTMHLTTPEVRYTVSLDDMANRVIVQYTTSYANIITGPTVQIQDGQAWARALLEGSGNVGVSATQNDLVSQGKYGVKQLILSGGEMSSGTADQLAANILAETKEPSVRESELKTSERGDGIYLTIECRGYIHTLGWRHYANSGGTTEDIQLIIKNIIDTIGLTTYIKTAEYGVNNMETNENFGGFRSALSILQDLTILGDSNANAFALGVYEDRHLIYKIAEQPIKQNVKYRYVGGGIFEDQQGRRLHPAELRPDNWMQVNRITGGATGINDLRQSLGHNYIESVRYREPDQVSVAGSQGGLLDALLSRLSLQGVR